MLSNCESTLFQNAINTIRNKTVCLQHRRECYTPQAHNVSARKINYSRNDLLRSSDNTRPRSVPSVVKALIN